MNRTIRCALAAYDFEMLRTIHLAFGDIIRFFKNSRLMFENYMMNDLRSDIYLLFAFKHLARLHQESKDYRQAVLHYKVMLKLAWDLDDEK